MSMLRKWSEKVQQKRTNDGLAPSSINEYQEESVSVDIISSSSHLSE